MAKMLKYNLPLIDIRCPPADEPSGYVSRSEWFDTMAKTHECLKCPKCLLWSIWWPKPNKRRVETMATAKDNRGMSPAPKTNEPNPLKPEGQISLYLGHLLAKRGKSADDLAEAIDVSRATVFNWLGGVTSPPVKHWASIAKFLGLKDWRAMVPTNAFVDSLKSK